MAGTRSANTADVEKSIQIALDAADAAMDVTSEYAKVAQQIKRSTAKLANIEKLGRIAVILGFVSGIGAAALCIVIFLQSSSQLKLLSQTNTELLTVFIENVDSLNEDVAKLTPALDQINNLTNVVETASAGLVKIGEKSDMMSEEVRVAIEKMNTIEPSVMAQLTDINTHWNDRMSNSVLNNKRLPDLLKFENHYKNSKEAIKFINQQKLKYLIKSKINNDQANIIRYKSIINLSHLSLKKKILIYIPNKMLLKLMKLNRLVRSWFVA